MIGAVIGDIVGSRFEFNNHRSKDFELFAKGCSFTDDSVMSLALSKAIMASKSDYSDLSKNAVKFMQEYGALYPYADYGLSFREWLRSDDPKPYNSFGNGAAMRISCAGIVGKTMDEVKILSKMMTEVTHNHVEGLKGAEATAVSIFLARSGKDKSEIKDFVVNNYYKINFKLDDIRKKYKFNETCQDTVPQALEAFFESTDFEDAIRNAISIGGDSDTLAAITGSVAASYYGVPAEIREKALEYLDDELRSVLLSFESKYK